MMDWIPKLEIILLRRWEDLKCIHTEARPRGSDNEISATRLFELKLRLIDASRLSLSKVWWKSSGFEPSCCLAVAGMEWVGL
jgi:hypothetical protein